MLRGRAIAKGFWGVLVTSFLGPYVTVLLSVVVGVLTDPGEDSKAFPLQYAMVAIPFVVGALGFPFVLPVAAVLAMSAKAARIADPWAYRGVGASVGPSLVLVLAYLTREVIPYDLELQLFTSCAALSGLLCGDLYWRMAVKPQRAGAPVDIP